MPRYLLATALLADAVAMHLLYRSFFFSEGRQPVLAATGLGLLVAAVAFQVAKNPTSLTLSLARGIAVVMAVGLAGVGLLLLLAANFESGIRDLPEQVALLLLALAVQIGILVAARAIDGQGPIESIGTAINGAFKFWAVGIVVVLILSLVENLIP